MRIKPENRFWIAIYGFTAFIMLIAMSVFGWLAWTSRNEPGVGRVAGARPMRVVNSVIPAERYELLSAFPAPEYVNDPAAPQGFRSAMALYQKQNYKAAASALRAIVDSKPDFAEARFYLGISLMLAGERAAGIDQLRAVAMQRDQGFLEQARFYLAKGLLADHDIPRAQQQLEAIVAQHGDLEKEATVLLSQIRPS